jgi:hypothetical protein
MSMLRHKNRFVAPFEQFGVWTKRRCFGDGESCSVHCIVFFPPALIPSELGKLGEQKASTSVYLLGLFVSFEKTGDTSKPLNVRGLLVLRGNAGQAEAGALKGGLHTEDLHGWMSEY